MQEFDNIYGKGITKRYHDYEIKRISKRKKRKLELSTEDVGYNKSHSKRGIVIEHTMCRLKKYRIPNDVFRNKLRRYSKVSDIVSGPVNYRIIKQFR